MTTNDIEKVQITMITKDGNALVGFSDNPIVLGMIAEFVKFIKLDPEKT